MPASGNNVPSVLSGTIHTPQELPPPRRTLPSLRRTLVLRGAAFPASSFLPVVTSSGCLRARGQPRSAGRTCHRLAEPPAPASGSESRLRQQLTRSRSRDPRGGDAVRRREVTIPQPGSRVRRGEDPLRRDSVAVRRRAVNRRRQREPRKPCGERRPGSCTGKACLASDSPARRGTFGRWSRPPGVPS